MPWNLPFWQVLRFFIPAALVGNVVLIKHAETVQGSAHAIAQLVRDAGGPVLSNPWAGQAYELIEHGVPAAHVIERMAAELEDARDAMARRAYLGRRPQ